MYNRGRIQPPKSVVFRMGRTKRDPGPISRRERNHDMCFEVILDLERTFLFNKNTMFLFVGATAMPKDGKRNCTCTAYVPQTPQKRQRKPLYLFRENLLWLPRLVFLLLLSWHSKRFQVARTSHFHPLSHTFLWSVVVKRDLGREREPLLAGNGGDADSWSTCASSKNHIL